MTRREVLRTAGAGWALWAVRPARRLFAAVDGASWPLRIGDVTIHRIVESEGAMIRPSGFFPGVDDGAIEEHHALLAPWSLDERGMLVFAIQSFLVRTRRHVILVDACVGAEGKREPGPADLSSIGWFRDLRVAGARPEDIDFVLCTHLHSDHVGWNTMRRDGTLVPTFPNAKYLFDKREWAYWSGRKEGDLGYEPIRDSVRPVVDAGRAQWIETPREIDEEARIEPIVGHTPGQVALRIRSEGREAVLVGDLAHHPVQLPEPDWDSKFSVDRETSIATRKLFLERHAGSDTIVVPAHFPSPTAGRVVKHRAAWRFAKITEASQ